MLPKLKAHQLFNKYYALLLQEDSDISEEILIGVLSIKCAVIACEEVKSQCESTAQRMYWDSVIKELKLM